MTGQCHIPGCCAIASSSGVFCLDHLMVAVDLHGQQAVEELLAWHRDPRPPFAPRYEQELNIARAIQRTQNMPAEGRP